MTTYTDVFGADTIPPSGLGYSAIALSADTTLQWPEFYSGTGSVLTPIMEVIPSAGGYALTVPDATKVSIGRDFMIQNPGSFSFTLKDNDGNVLTTISAGTSHYYYLKDNSTNQGTWGQIAYGVGTSSVDAATLIGYGIKAITTTLNQSHPTSSFSGNLTVGATHRAKVLIGISSGTSTLSLTTAPTMGDDFFFMYRNSGTGTTTIDPAGSETIDGQTTMSVQPGESLMVICNGSSWYSVGYGRSMLYQFTQLVYDLTAGGPFTLTAAEASNKLITFIGSPSADVTVYAPQTVSVYYLYNNLSTAHAISFKTVAGAGVGIAQTARIIAVCDGTYIVSAQSVTANTQVSLVNGTVTNPALNFSAATNTGLYLNGASGIGVAIAGSAALLFDNSGNMTTTKTLNGLTISTTTGTLTIAAGKTLTLSKTMQFTAADDTGVYTFPIGTQSLAMLGAQTFTGLQTFGAGISIPTGFNVTGAGTAQVTGFATVSATSLAGTLTTAAQGNVTSLGTLTSLTMGGNIALGANYLSRAGTAAGLSLDASNNATFSANLSGLGIGIFGNASAARQGNATVTAWAPNTASTPALTAFKNDLGTAESAFIVQNGTAGGTTVFSISSAGNITQAGSITAGAISAGAISGTSGDFSSNVTMSAVSAQLSVGSGGTGATNPVFVMNGGSASNGGPYQVFKRNNVVKGYLGTSSAVIGGSGDDINLYATSNLVFYAGSTLVTTLSSTGLSVTGTLSATGGLFGSTLVGSADTGRYSTGGIRFRNGSAGTSILTVMPNGGSVSAGIGIYNVDDNTGTNVGRVDIGISTATPDTLTIGYVTFGTGTAVSKLSIAQSVTINTTNASPLTLTQTSTGEVNLAWLRAGGVAATWSLYVPSASSDIRFYSGGDRMSLSATGSLTIPGTGPHAIGGATSANSAMLFTGSTTGAVRGVDIENTLNPSANAYGLGTYIGVTLNKAGSGTHPDFAALYLDAPTIGAGAATLTNATTLKITGAPSVGTNKYSLWCIASTAGDIRLDSTSANGSVATVLGSVGPVGSHTTVQEWLTININGNIRYIPAF